MRLLHTGSLELWTYLGSAKPKYAILSHTWDVDEILFHDITTKDKDWVYKKGYEKVKRSCEEARRYGLDYIWIDTCCIDKSSSTELSEAINSMYQWYQEAETCFAYLADKTWYKSLSSCRWFSRGWTLQEMIAPEDVRLYDVDWNFIGDKLSMANELSSITGIDEYVLKHGHNDNADGSPYAHRLKREIGRESVSVCGCRPAGMWDILRSLSVATIMSWAANRHTTRDEDLAYCLLGLFSVNMPLLYGEGNRAFFRLQEQIVQKSNDQSILGWRDDDPEKNHTYFASRPECFSSSKLRPRWTYGPHREDGGPEIGITIGGLSVDMLLCAVPSKGDQVYLGILDCSIEREPLARPAILLRQLGGSRTFVRHNPRFMYKIRPEWQNHTFAIDFVTEIQSSIRTELDLGTAEMRRITLVEAAQGISSVVYSLPPLRIRSVQALSVGGAFPKVLSDSLIDGHVHRNTGTLYFRETESFPRFFVTWAVPPVAGVGGEDGIWCKLSTLGEISWATDIVDERRRADQIISQAWDHGLYSGYFPEWGYDHRGSPTDMVVLHCRGWDCRITANITSKTFLGRTMLELEVDITRSRVWRQESSAYWKVA